MCGILVVVLGCFCEPFSGGIEALLYSVSIQIQQAQAVHGIGIVQAGCSGKRPDDIIGFLLHGIPL